MDTASLDLSLVIVKLPQYKDDMIPILAQVIIIRKITAYDSYDFNIVLTTVP